MLAGAGRGRDPRRLTKGRGTDLVLDLVGVDSTIALAVAVARPLSDVALIGIGMGSYPFSFITVPYEVSLASTYWGSVTELVEVIALAEEGHIRAHVEQFSSTARRRPTRGWPRATSQRAVIVP